ncbi:unnamed protein product [Closterium sp. NIES-53]
MRQCELTRTNSIFQSTRVDSWPLSRSLHRCRPSHGSQRWHSSSGLATALAAAVVALAPLLATTIVDAKCDSTERFKGPVKGQNALFFTGANCECNDVDRRKLGSAEQAEATIEWNGYVKADHRCRSISFHSKPGCVGAAYDTRVHPPPEDSSFDYASTQW